jgi:hypothetical protein
VDYDIFLPDHTGVPQIEQQLKVLYKFRALLGQVSPVCLDAYSRYSCSKAYPKCVTGDSTNSKYFVEIKTLTVLTSFMLSFERSRSMYFCL